MMELPYWTDLLADASILWRAALCYGAATLVGIGILLLADHLQRPKWLAIEKKPQA